MTPSQLSAIRARLDAVPRVLRSSVFVDIEVNDLRALLDEVERLTNALAGRDKPVEELNAEGRIWRAYRNRELTEDEARERLAALKAEEAR
jgi:hypothetical protein